MTELTRQALEAVSDDLAGWLGIEVEQVQIDYRSGQICVSAKQARRIVDHFKEAAGQRRFEVDVTFSVDADDMLDAELLVQNALREDKPGLTWAILDDAVTEVTGA